MEKTLDQKFDEHVDEDRKNFDAMHERFDCMDKKLDEIKDSMTYLKDLSNFFRGTSLLKKPLMMFVALVVGVVALFGGLKTIISWFVIK